MGADRDLWGADILKHRLDWRDGWLFHGEHKLGRDGNGAARELLRLNLAARDDTFTTYRGEMPCLTAGVGWMADRRVVTNAGGTPVFKRITPDNLARGSQTGVSEGNDTDGAEVD